MAALSQPVTVILTSLSAGHFNIDWKAMGLMAIGSAATYLLKNLGTPSQSVTTPARILFVLVAITVATAGQAQSLTKPIPKADTALSSLLQHSISVNAAGDSVYLGFRFTGPTVLYALPNSAIFTGVGISYEHDTYRTSTKKWYTDWSVAAGGYAGGQYAPTTWQAVTAVGLSVSFFNKLVTVGVLYNFMSHQAQVGAGPTVSLNN